MYCEDKVKNCEETGNQFPSEEHLARFDEARSEYETLYDHIIQGKLDRGQIGMNMGKIIQSTFLTLKTQNQNEL